MAPEVMPRDARLIALMLSANPAITDAHPSVVHQLMEFAHRYTHQVLTDALVYSEHAGRGGSVEEEDVKLAVQSRVGWEFGGRVPKEFLLALATKTNSKPLPPVPEVFGVRLPPAKHCLTAVDFDLVPNKPPPNVGFSDSDEDEEDEDEDADNDKGDIRDEDGDLEMADELFGVDADSAAGTTQVNLTGTQSLPRTNVQAGDEDEDEGAHDDLFDGEDEDGDMQDADEEGTVLNIAGLNGLEPMVNGAGTGEKRRFDDEDEDYDA